VYGGVSVAGQWVPCGPRNAGGCGDLDPLGPGARDECQHVTTLQKQTVGRDSERSSDMNSLG
jgi:hypothetical protein